MTKLNMRMELSLFTESQLEALFRKALEVWREIAFRVQGTDEFYDFLSDYGCGIKGEQVSFPRPVRDKVLARIAEEKRTREEENAGASPWPEPELRMYTHGQALHICELETNENRPATEEDLARWPRAVDALPGTGSWSAPSWPCSCASSRAGIDGRHESRDTQSPAVVR